MAWQDIPAFMERLRAEPGKFARALEFTILTAARIGEVMGNGIAARSKPPMAIEEVDFSKRLWTVPASRTKVGKLHIVPLPDRALEIAVEAAGTLKVHSMALAPLLKRLGAQVTIHGFRATFRSWAEEAGYGSDPRLVEFALAHSLPDKVEASYNRVTRVEERRVLMQRWADFCAGVAVDAKVVKLRKA
jgi:hypothetical protein